VDQARPEPLRFTTLKVGATILDFSGQTIELDVRVLLGSDGSYRLLTGALSGPLPDLDAAVAEAAPLDVRWRADLAPLASGERPCPICGAPASRTERYPRRLCPACVLEATDAARRPLRFANAGMSGGFVASYADDGVPYSARECFVRGVPCLADEHHFGGIVVQVRDDQPARG
jgi:hypothetical protein